MKYIYLLLFALISLPGFSQKNDSPAEQKELKMFYKGEDKPYTGPCVGYYENGQLGKEGKYVDGFMQDTCKWWYRTGEIKKEVVYDKGNILQKKVWDKSGKLTEQFP